jgi:hypothetical protein
MKAISLIAFMLTKFKQFIYIVLMSMWYHSFIYICVFKTYVPSKHPVMLIAKHRGIIFLKI